MKKPTPDSQGEHYFVNRIFSRLMLPTLTSGIFISLAGVADALVVGTSMGAAGLAAMSYVYPIYMLYNVITIGLSSGAVIVYSKAVGEGNTQAGQSVFHSAFTFLLLCGAATAFAGLLFPQAILRLLGAGPAEPVVFAAAGQYASVLLIFGVTMFLQMLLYNFLLCDDAPRLAGAGMLVGNILDLSLNVVLVLWLDWGVQGAAWSTILGALASDLIFLPHFLPKAAPLRLKLSAIDWKKLWRSYSIGMSYSSQSVYQMVTVTVMNHLLGGLLGTAGVAMYEVLLSCRTFVLTLLESVGETLRVLVSTFFSERSQANIRHTMRLCFATVGVIIGILLLLGLLAPTWICGVFGMETPNVGAVRSYLYSLPFFAFNTIMVLYYQAIESERLAYGITILQSLLLFVPLALLFVAAVPAYVWWLFLAVELATLLCWLPPILRGRGLWQLLWQEDGRVVAFALTKNDGTLGQVLEQVEAFCQQWNADTKQAYFVPMAVEEICCAIQNHRSDLSDNHYIQLTVISEEDGCFVLHVRDSAQRFNVFSLGENSKINSEPDMDSVGIQVIRSKAQMWNYRHYQGFNTLVVRI